MYASFIQNTSLKPDDFLNLTIPQLEYLLEGCRKNTEEMNKNIEGKETLEGADAIQYLIDSGEMK